MLDHASDCTAMAAEGGQEEAPDRGSGPWAELPVEWLEQVLSFMSVTDLHRGCMRVNREWEYASRYVLKQQRCLKVGVREEWSAGDYDLDIVRVDGRTDITSLTTCLIRMTGVVKLVMNSLTTPELLHLIEVRAPTLQSLICCKLPEREGLLFPRLRKLHLSSIRIPPAIGTKAWVHIMMSMKCVTDLRVRVPRAWRGNDGVVAVFHLFTGYTCLKCLEVCADHDSNINMDSAVATLVSRNPGLEKLVVTGFKGSDASLISLSTLTQLKEVRVSNSDQEVTTDGVLTLLRGGCRSSLSGMLLHRTKELDNYQVRQEILAIAAERQQQTLDESFGPVHVVFRLSS